MIIVYNCTHFHDHILILGITAVIVVSIFHKKNSQISEQIFKDCWYVMVCWFHCIDFHCTIVQQ